MRPGVGLYPMGVGQIIDASIKMYRRNWKTLTAVVAFVLVPYALLRSVLLERAGFNFNAFHTSAFPANGTVPTFNAILSQAYPGNTLAIVGVALAVQYLFVTPFLTAAVARAAADAYLGREITVGRVYRAALSRFHSVLWVSLLTAIPVLIGFAFLFVPGIFLLVRWILAPVVVVLEEARGTKALGRAWHLSKGFWWRMLGLGLLAYLISEAVGLIIGLVFLAGTAVAGPAAWVVNAAGSALATVLITPFVTVTLVHLYFDLRIRKEAFDLSILASQLPAPQQP